MRLGLANARDRMVGPTTLLVVYCVLILSASLAGGWLPLWMRLTHTRLQVATSFVAGLMLGVGILHLLPHALEQFHSAESTMAWLLGGFLAMFLVQRYLHFHHHDVPEDAPETRRKRVTAPIPEAGHEEHNHNLTLADRSARQLSWVGAAVGLTVHTLLDGVALAASVDLERRAGHTHGFLGLGTFLVIFLHKPFDAMAVGTLMAVGGSPRSLRHWVNGLLALANPVGLLLFYLGAERLSQFAPHFLGAVLAFAAGTFLSIATSDLLPELQFHSHDRGKLSLALLAGVGVAALIAAIENASPAHTGSLPRASHVQRYVMQTEMRHPQPDPDSTGKALFRMAGPG